MRKITLIVVSLILQIRGRKELILFEPHDNTKLYEAHIPEALLGFNAETGEFRRKTLMDSTSMVMAPVDIQDPDFEVGLCIPGTTYSGNSLINT